MVESKKYPPTLEKLMSGEPSDIICGMPKSTYFHHTTKKAIVIGVSDYSELRENEGKESYADLPQTKEDIKNIISGLKRLGFNDDAIILMKEPTWKELHIQIISLAKDIHTANAESNERTLAFVYYAGHGMYDNHLLLQLNEIRLYPIEKMLRSIAKADGSYVMALFDCCREKISKKETRGLTEGGDEEDMFNPTGMVVPESQENFIITYGCPPSEGVPAKSTIAKAYIRYLKKSATKDGFI